MNAALEVQDISLAFEGVQAAQAINLTIATGERLAIVGPNGAGKTTFVNICTGFLRPTKGRIVVHGKVLGRLTPRRAVHEGLARSFQHPQLFWNETVYTNLLLAVAAHQHFWNLRAAFRYSNRVLCDELLERFRIESLAHARSSALSQGDRKLLDIAMAYAARPRILILDEPTSGVSSEEKLPLMRTVLDAVDADETTLVFVEHDFDVVRDFAHRVAVWRDGVVMAIGETTVILSQPDVQQVLFGR